LSVNGEVFRKETGESMKTSAISGWKSQEGYTITIDLNSSKPIYLQICDSVITQIAMGILTPGEKLPSSRRLSSALGINYHTVNRAYSQLIQEGYVTLDRRKRITINEIPEGKRSGFDPIWVERMKVILSEAVSKGFNSDMIMVKIQSILEDIESTKDE
jgi:DNA-binding transcriptional regulator YhcF (GntR family)